LFNVGVQAYSQRSGAARGQPDARRVRRALHGQVGPLGFWEIPVRPRPPYFLFDKDIPTLTLARRERKALDALIFGDR
jgi:hypothetical protein